MELSKADTLYLLIAVQEILKRELKVSDRVMFERLYYKLKISHNGQKIREAVNGKSITQQKPE